MSCGPGEMSIKVNRPASTTAPPVDHHSILCRPLSFFPSRDTQSVPKHSVVEFVFLSPVVVGFEALSLSRNYPAIEPPSAIPRNSDRAKISISSPRVEHLSGYDFTASARVERAISFVSSSLIMSFPGAGAYGAAPHQGGYPPQQPMYGPPQGYPPQQQFP